MKKTLFLFIIISFLSTISAQTVNIVLKNSKVVFGEIVQESPEFVIITNDTGELKISRLLIESITYKTSEQSDSGVSNKAQVSRDKILNSKSELGNVILDDLVLIFLKNEDIVSGRLVAKSLDVIIVQTESGSLTIPKREINKIEYLSSEFSERGEVVIAHLINDTHFEGNIYFEDSNNLVLDTKIGRLTIDKKNLRSIEYTGATGRGDETLLSEYANSQPILINAQFVEKRFDIISIGYSPSFGADYGTGLGLAYASKFLLSQMEGFYLSAVGGINLNYFTLNKDNFKDVIPTVSASGGTFISMISFGASFTLQQQSDSKFEFYIAPQLEANLIYKTLKNTYPSYPAFDTKISSTEFNFGIGNKIGIDILITNMKIGISYDSHFIFGDEDFNTISLNFTSKLF